MKLKLYSVLNREITHRYTLEHSVENIQPPHINSLIKQAKRNYKIIGRVFISSKLKRGWVTEQVFPLEE